MRCLEEFTYDWIEVDVEKCNKCGVCVDMCPMDVMHFGRKGYPFMKWSGLSERKSSRSRKGSNAGTSLNPNTLLRCTPAPSIVSLLL